jgi:toxin YhaV
MTMINGWQLLAHPCFIDQFERLIAAVTKERAKSPDSYQKSNNAKLLAAIQHLTCDAIPQDPTKVEFRQGHTLGPTHKHWFRAKFAQGRFRLFFRYNLAAKIIIYAWVNDETTLRTYGSKTDAYAVFKNMLNKGNPPDDWTALLGASTSLSQ